MSTNYNTNTNSSKELHAIQDILQIVDDMPAPMMKSKFIDFFSSIDSCNIEFLDLLKNILNNSSNKSTTNNMAQIAEQKHNLYRNCVALHSTITECMKPVLFPIEITHKIHTYLKNSIPQNGLILYLDASNFDSISHFRPKDHKSELYYGQQNNLLVSEWHSMTENNLCFTITDICRTANNFPILCTDVVNGFGYLKFNHEQILTSQELIQIFPDVRNANDIHFNGVSLILVFRCDEYLSDIGQQRFILNYGNSYCHGRHQNTEIGIDVGCEPDLTQGYDSRIRGCFGIHSGRGNAIVAAEKQKIQKNEWYLITILMKSVTNVEYYLNGSEIAIKGKNCYPKNQIGVRSGFGNSCKAPIDIGGRIDGNWIVPDIRSHMSECGNCHFYGDISAILLYDRLLNMHEKKHIEKQFLNRIKTIKTK